MQDLKILPTPIQSKLAPYLEKNAQDRLDFLLNAFLQDDTLHSEYKKIENVVKEKLEEEKNPALKDIQTIFEHTIKIKQNEPVQPLTFVEEIHNNLKRLAAKEINIQQFMNICCKKPQAIFVNTPFSKENLELLEKISNDELKFILSYKVRGAPLFHDGRILKKMIPILLEKNDPGLIATLLIIKSDRGDVTLLHNTAFFKELSVLFPILPSHLLVVVLTRVNCFNETPLHFSDNLHTILEFLKRVTNPINPSDVYASLTLKDLSNKTPMSLTIDRTDLFKTLAPYINEMTNDEIFDLLTIRNIQRKTPMHNYASFIAAIPLINKLSPEQIFSILKKEDSHFIRPIFHIYQTDTVEQIMPLFNELTPAMQRELFQMHPHSVPTIFNVLLENKKINSNIFNQAYEIENIDLRTVYDNFKIGLYKNKHYVSSGNETEYMKSIVIDPTIASEASKATLTDFGSTLVSLIRKTLGEPASSSLDPNEYMPTSFQDAKSSYEFIRKESLSKYGGAGVKDLDLAYGSLCMALCKIFKIKGIRGSMDKKAEISMKIMDALGNILFSNLYKNLEQV